MSEAQRESEKDAYAFFSLVRISRPDDASVKHRRVWLYAQDFK